MCHFLSKHISHSTCTWQLTACLQSEAPDCSISLHFRDEPKLFVQVEHPTFLHVALLSLNGGMRCQSQALKSCLILSAVPRGNESTHGTHCPSPRALSEQHPKLCSSSTRETQVQAYCNGKAAQQDPCPSHSFGTGDPDRSHRAVPQH